jgi:hypothetical protein
MPSIQSVVEAVSIKEMPQPDNYGNTYRANIKVGEDWYSYGAIKKDAINIKKGDEWVQLQKGMEVEFMYDQNGDWKNIKKKTFSILSTDTPKKTEPAKKVGNNFTPRGTSNVNPAEVGQCLNLAAQVMGLSSSALLDKEEVTKAIRWYKQVRELFSELYPAVEAEAPQPKKKEAPKPTEDDYDDEDV